jgi:hypothetical protein
MKEMLKTTALFIDADNGRRSRTEADRLVLEYEQSGLRRKAFCQRHGIALHTLDYYRRQRRIGLRASSGC